MSTVQQQSPPAVQPQPPQLKEVRSSAQLGRIVPLPELPLSEILSEEMPERLFFKYNIIVTDASGEVVREMEILRPLLTDTTEKEETLRTLAFLHSKVQEEPDRVPFLNMTGNTVKLSLAKEEIVLL